MKAFKASTELYRTIKGERYIGWGAWRTEEVAAAYRAAGVKCIRRGVELLVRQSDAEQALKVDLSAIAIADRPPANPKEELTVSDADRRRFEAKLERQANGCLLFTGTLSKRGRYGKFDLNGRMERAHRLAFRLGGGVLSPEKPHVLHKCDATACCEFAHLFAGTHAENMADMARKGRGTKSKKGMPCGVRRLRSGRFQARIKAAGTVRYLGTFNSAEEAAAAAVTAKESAYACG